ncbi:hypothetical protein VDGL01_10168 [Verticillium dahliae]
MRPHLVRLRTHEEKRHNSLVPAGKHHITTVPAHLHGHQSPCTWQAAWRRLKTARRAYSWQPASPGLLPDFDSMTQAP